MWLVSVLHVLCLSVLRMWSYLFTTALTAAVGSEFVSVLLRALTKVPIVVQHWCRRFSVDMDLFDLSASLVCGPLRN